MTRFGLTFLFALLTVFASTQNTDIVSGNHSLLNINPSFAGSNGSARLQSSHRNYSLFEKDYRFNTSFLSADGFIKKTGSGLGLNFIRKNYSGGLLLMDRISLVFAQHIKIQKNLKIIPSVQIHYQKAQFDPSVINFANGALAERADVAIGALIKISDSWYLGSYIYDLARTANAPFTDFNNGKRLSVNAAYTFRFSASSMLQLSGRYFREGFFRGTQVNGTLLIFKHLVAGCGIWTNDRAFALVGYRNNQISFQLSHDYTISRLAGSTIGAWELSASLNLKKPGSEKRPVLFEER